MRHVLEMQNLEIETLCELRSGYTNGDFERFAKYLTEESVFESQWFNGIMQNNDWIFMV